MNNERQLKKNLYSKQGNKAPNTLNVKEYENKKKTKTNTIEDI